MDYNEDRQIILDQNDSGQKEYSLAKSVIEEDKDKHANIYLNTVGRQNIIRAITLV